MPSTLKDLREERAALYNQMTEIWDRTDGKPDGADAERYDKLENDLDAKGDQIERAERKTALDAKLSAVDRNGVVPKARGTFGQPDEDEPDDDQAAYDKAFTAFVRSGIMDLSPEDRALLAQGANSAKEIKAALGSGATTAGGYTIPPEFRDAIIETMKWYGPMLQVAEVITTDSGVSLPWPTNNDTANMGAILAENTAISQQDLTFGTANLGSFMYTSLLVLVSWQLLQDRPDIDTFLAKKLGQRLGRILNNHWTVGTGTSQPTGLVTGGSVGVTGTGSFAGTGGISGDNIIDLVESLDPAYGASPNLSFMGHQSVRKALRKLKDGQQRYLWEISLQNGVPDSLAGYQFKVNNDMATLAQNSKSLAFGDFEAGYIIRIVKEQQLVRLNERYADSLQTGFFAFTRADGNVQDNNAYKIFQSTATA